MYIAKSLHTQHAAGTQNTQNIPSKQLNHFKEIPNPAHFRCSSYIKYMGYIKGVMHKCCDVVSKCIMWFLCSMRLTHMASCTWAWGMTMDNYWPKGKVRVFWEGKREWSTTGRQRCWTFLSNADTDTSTAFSVSSITSTSLTDFIKTSIESIVFVKLCTTGHFFLY